MFSPQKTEGPRLLGGLSHPEVRATMRGRMVLSSLLRTELVREVLSEICEPLVLVLGNQDVEDVVLLPVKAVLTAEERDGEQEFEDGDALAGHLAEQFGRVDCALEELGEQLADLRGVASADAMQVERVGARLAAGPERDVLAGQFDDVFRDGSVVPRVRTDARLPENPEGAFQCPVRVAGDAVRAVGDLPLVVSGLTREALEDGHFQEHRVEAGTVGDQPVAPGTITDDTAVKGLVEALAFDGQEVPARSVDLVAIRAEKRKVAEIISGFGHTGTSSRGQDLTFGLYYCSIFGNCCQFRRNKAKNSHVGVLSIRTMVRVLDSRWNHFVPSLYLMHRKLAELGVVLVEGKVCHAAEDGTLR